MIPNGNKIRAVLWFAIPVLAITVWATAVAILIGGCDMGDTPGCIPGDTRCEGDVLWTCSDAQGWEHRVDCSEQEGVLGSTCCAIEGITGCNFRVSCEIVEYFCDEMQTYLDAYCEGV